MLNIYIYRNIHYAHSVQHSSIYQSDCIPILLKYLMLIRLAGNTVVYLFLFRNCVVLNTQKFVCKFYPEKEFLIIVHLIKSTIRYVLFFETLKICF